MVSGVGLCLLIALVSIFTNDSLLILKGVTQQRRYFLKRAA